MSGPPLLATGIADIQDRQLRAKPGSRRAKKEAAQRRLLNSILTIADQAAINADCDFRR